MEKQIVQQYRPWELEPMGGRETNSAVAETRTTPTNIQQEQ